MNNTNTDSKIVSTDKQAPQTINLNDEAPTNDSGDLLHKVTQNGKMFCVNFVPAGFDLMVCHGCEPEVEQYNLCPGCSEDLAAYEDLLHEKLHDFLIVGTTIAKIRSRRLYRETHAKFSEYFDELCDKILLEDPDLNYESCGGDTPLSLDQQAGKSAQRN